jgi:hypothetical protein
VAEVFLRGYAAWDLLPLWKRVALRAAGLKTSYVIRQTGREVSEIVRKMQRGETASGL